MTFSIDNPRGVATTPLRKICLGKPLGEQGLKHNVMDRTLLISMPFTLNSTIKFLEWIYLEDW